MKLNKNLKTAIWAVSIFFILLILLSIYTYLKNDTVSVFNQTHLKQTVIVDAGHGGADGGAIGIDGTVEKEINLQIANKLKCILHLYGYNVIMTRDDDESIHDDDAKTIRQKKVSDIHNRERIINENPDAVFISIHQNKYSDTAVHGTQVFYSKNNPLSPSLAQNVQDSVVENLQKDNYKTIKKSGTEIYLLYHSPIPSIMVECGFVSNSDELTKLKDQEYQLKLAESIADGILNFYKEQDENNGGKR
ncbi:MAG: N-acetylmuramoyl-L-alanine amidase [Clostridia bacterium]|nr:N-acetylmuramoyl-L-alanine amidase [Clostridia bacterium]